MLTWDNVTKQLIKTLMIAEFGNKEPDISSVLAQFGPDRLKKAKDMKVSKFFHLWKEQLPDCLQPTTPEDFKKCVDLLQRCIFYQCLDDRYLQEQLCNIKSDNLTMKQFYDEAIVAEAKRKTFEDTSEKSNNLDPSSAVSINKAEYASSGNNSEKRGRVRLPARGRAPRSTGTAGAGCSNYTPGTSTSNPNSNFRGKHAKDNVKQKKPPTCWTCQEVGHTKWTCNLKIMLKSQRVSKVVLRRLV